jgi:hypothetical protein
MIYGSSTQDKQNAGEEMHGIFRIPNCSVVAQNNHSQQHIQITFKAYVDTKIPQTPNLAKQYGNIQFFGALDFDTDEFLTYSLNQFDIPLADAVADLLDITAKQYILVNGSNVTKDESMYSSGSAFASLSPNDRTNALNLLIENQIDFTLLPEPFQNNPDFIHSTMSNLNRLTYMGYYSEWFGYGSTRLATPNDRILEFNPKSWEQIEYPGRSLGYPLL